MVGHRAERPVVGTALLLWGPNFHEAAATIFTTELREAAVAVKLVGITGQHAAGLHGLLLSADLTLGQALRLNQPISALILPCSLATLRRIDNDPRVYELLRLACANGARFVVHDPVMLEETRLKELLLAREQVLFYDEIDTLVATARFLAALLLDTGR